MESNHILINVGRQLGSGGHDIGRMLALDFNAKYYDRELLNLAAKESGLSEHVFEQHDERKSFLRSFLNLPNGMASANYGRQGFSQDTIFQFQSEAILKAAEEGSCVFVGRCADYVLRDYKNVVNVFITASMDFRVNQIMSKLNYEVLAGIYPKRKEHKLDEWRELCSWIKSLPYSEIITLEETDEV